MSAWIIIFFSVGLIIFIFLLKLLLPHSKDTWLNKNNYAIRRLQNNQKRGNQGEQKVIRILNDFHKPEYFVFNDYYLKNKTKICQIDHILISNKFIYVIETKNYYHRTIYDYQSSQFYNKNQISYSPFNQNHFHLDTLRNFLTNNNIQIHNKAIFNIIVFANNNLFFKNNFDHKSFLSNENKYLVNLNELKPLINYLENQYNHLYKIGVNIKDKINCLLTNHLFLKERNQQLHKNRYQY